MQFLDILIWSFSRWGRVRIKSFQWVKSKNYNGILPGKRHAVLRVKILEMHVYPNIYIKYLCGRSLRRFFLFKGKPRGLRTARKLRLHRRDQRWHDKDYKKSHLGTRWKANPFGGASHAKGIVLEKV